MEDKQGKNGGDVKPGDEGPRDINWTHPLAGPAATVLPYPEGSPPPSVDVDSSRIFHMEMFISKSLRWGVLISAAVIFAGFALLLATGQSGYAEGVFPTGLGDVFTGLATLKPFAVIALGLALLIATPVFRVGSSIVAFALEGDRLYVGITVFVFAVLMLSFFLGKAGG